MNNNFDVWEELIRIINNQPKPNNPMEECKHNLNKLERMLRMKK